MQEEKDKVRREKLAGLFFDLAKLSFAGLVVGGIVSMKPDVDITLDIYRDITGRSVVRLKLEKKQKDLCEVEKAEDAGEETGGCEKNCSGDEWMGLMGRRHGSSEMAEGFGYIYVGAGE